MYVSAFIGANENFEKAAKSKSAINDSSNKAQDKSSLRDDVQKMESVRYWYPNMSKSEITYVRRIAKLELSTTNNYIDNENKWLYNAKNGNAYFALYSTADVNEPTILYACKGKRAEFEHQFLSKSFEKEVDNNGDIYFRTKIIESILGKYGYVISGANVGNRNVVGGRSNNRNVGVYSKNSRIRPSEALLNCLRNIRETQKRNERNRLEQYSDRDTLSNTSNKAQNLLTNPLVDASNNFQDNKEQKNTADEGGVKKSEREKFAEYNKPITLDDIKVLRSIGRKSINAFTAEEVETAQKWAYKFYKQLGTKSPFFRRWFGDWRAYDDGTAKFKSNIQRLSLQTPQQAKEYFNNGVKNKTLFRGDVKNDDTGFVINVGAHVYNDTLTYSNRELSRHNNVDDYQIRLSILSNIQTIVKFSILFDTEIALKGDKESQNMYQSFFHKFYTIAEFDGKQYLVKLTVDELNSDSTTRRAYNVNDIKISPVAVSQVYKPADTTDDSGDLFSTISISDLFNLVKNYDAEFKPKHVNKALIENGKPKVFYHGAKKNGGFTEFRSWQYFTDNKTYAERYAERGNENSLYEVFLTANKIFDTRDEEAKSIFEKIRQEYGLGELQDTGLPDWTDGYDLSDYLDEHPELGYDAIILDEGGDLVDGKPVSRGESIVIKDSTQIKSAEDGGNIGTFSEAEGDIRYSERDYPIDDLKYEHAVKNNPEKAREMLDKRRKEQGYNDNFDWRMDHKAPNSHDDTAHSIDQLDKAYGGDGSLYSSKAVYYYGEGRAYDRKAIKVIQSVRNNPDAMVTIYRAVPTSIKDTRVRNGDWVAIVKEYAEEHGNRVLDGDYRIIENTVPAKYLFSNGDSINEFGYDNGNRNEVYKNTAANVKLDEITYDDNGNIIPISQRFNDEDSDIRYSERDYSYDTLVSKPDMKITAINDKIAYHSSPTIRKNVVDKAIKNASTLGKTNENGNILINVGDIDKDVILSRNGLRHGLDRRFDLLVPITLKAGEILKNSIKINELTPKNEHISKTYVLIGAAKNLKSEPYIVSFVVNRATNEVTSVDVLYAINAKTEPTGSLSPSVPANIADYFTGSSISISKLLDYVNKYFPDILPESVLKHYGHTERPEGKLGESAIFSDRNLDMDNRTLLSNALASTAKNEIEKKYIEQYQESVYNINCNE